MFLFTLLNFASAKVLPVSSINASSHFVDDKSGDNYEPKKIADQKSSEAWVEDDSGAGLGAWVELNLGTPQKITEIEIWNGNWYSYNQWDYYNRVAKVEIQFDDGSKELFDMANEKSSEHLKLKKPVTSKTVKVIIRGVHTGSAYTDRTAISEIKIKNELPEAYPIAKIAGSSALEEDNDGNYEAGNLQDHLLDTAWCAKGENDEFVTLDFGKSTKISQLEIVNGNAANFKIFMGYSRPKSLVLEFSDGSTQKVPVKPSPKMQIIPISPVKSTSVKVYPNDIMTGKSLKHVCLSEMYFK